MNSNYQPHGKGNLFQLNKRLVFKGNFVNGKVELRDIVKKIKDDKKVVKYFEMFGGCYFREHFINSICERGEFVVVFLLLLFAPVAHTTLRQRNAEEIHLPKNKNQSAKLPKPPLKPLNP